MNNWYNEYIFYHLYPLGVCHAAHNNEDRSKITGTINAIYQWIPHIKELGCNAIYFGPIFLSSTHGYDTTDYVTIDNRLGTNMDFKKIVEALHKHDIKVVIDGVFNHTGKEFFAFKDIKEQTGHSIYKEWYKGVGFNNNGEDGFFYENWGGHSDLPKLNLQNDRVVTYLLDCVKYWIGYFDVDGIRLDCADCLDKDFMRRLRSLTSSCKKDFWLMGEVIHGDYNLWANDEMLHSVTNYECYKGLYSSHNDINLFEIAYTLNREFNKLTGIYKNLHLYNFVDNHDVNRLASTVTKPEYMYTIYTLLFTIPGIPSIYYGSEWGIGGEKEKNSDWPLRPYIHIENFQANHSALWDTIKNLAEIRNNSLALMLGEYEQLYIGHEQFAFKREYKDECMIVLINTAKHDVNISLQVNGESCNDILNKGEQFQIVNGFLNVHIYPCWGRILKLV